MQSLFADPFLPPPMFAAPTAPPVKLPKDVRDSVGLLEVVVDPDRVGNPKAAEVTALTKTEVNGSEDSLLPVEPTSPPTTPMDSEDSTVGLWLLAVPVPPDDEEEEAVELASDPREAEPLLSNKDREELTDEKALDPKSGQADDEVAEEEELVEVTKESVKVGESPRPSSADS